MRIAVLLVIAACGSSQPTTRGNHEPIGASSPASTTSPELSPALAPLAWWLGDWEGASGSEHWIAAAGAIYGVALIGDNFEAMIVDDGEGPGKADGELRFIAMPGGARAVEFRKRELADGTVTFANDAHDFPKAITYKRDGDGLAAVIAGDGKSQPFAFRRGHAVPAPELEAADRAFSEDTGEHGVDGWVAAFDVKGAMLRKTGRVEGKAAIAEAMRALLGSGKLAWAPIASGRRGDLGFTVGKATFTGTKPDDSWRSTYVTIWKKQTDGSWKVWFDVGRVVND